MATLFIYNYSVLELFGIHQNTYKLHLISTAQMWGSGKTYLGKHFLSKLSELGSEDIKDIFKMKLLNAFQLPRMKLHSKDIMSLKRLVMSTST